MSNLRVGNVLWLHLKPSKDEPYMEIEHPYLIVKITEHIVEVLQLDTFDKDRLWRATKKSSVIISKDDPTETVILKDCFAHLEKLITIERFDGLTKYLKRDDVLSNSKLNRVQFKQQSYSLDNPIVEERYIMNYSQEEVEENNPIKC